LGQSRSCRTLYFCCLLTLVRPLSTPYGATDLANTAVRTLLSSEICRFWISQLHQRSLLGSQKLQRIHQLVGSIWSSSPVIMACRAGRCGLTWIAADLVDDVYQYEKWLILLNMMTYDYQSNLQIVFPQAGLVCFRAIPICDCSRLRAVVLSSQSLLTD
jgi:hypothetical protein